MTRKKRKVAPEHFNKKKLKAAVMKLFFKEPGRTFNYKQIAAALGIMDAQTKNLVTVSLDELQEQGKIEVISRGKYKLISHEGYATGVIEADENGESFLIPDGGRVGLVYIPHNKLLNTFEGDTVKVKLFAKRRKKHLEGEVVEVISRAKSKFVGTVEVTKNFAFLIPSSRVKFDIFIPKAELNGARHGQKAIAEITDWPSRAKNPFGTIIDVLGDSGSNNAEMHAILAEYNLPYEYPQNIINEAEKISDVIDEKEIKNRRDMRSVPTCTIDPVDAKDFDDALSFQVLKNGNYEVGVHIADVTHYVTPGSLIEEEAKSRATSVYLVDRVVPMLPERLSNFICSLRPNEDKLCFSAVFELNEKAEIVKEWFGRTVIHSNRRFTYEEAQTIIETEEGEQSDVILPLNRLAVQLRTRRMQHGAFNFERNEVRFNLDEDGKPLSVYFKEPKASNELIEEFMLLANKQVARFIGKPKQQGDKARTFIYRIHDKPDPEKLQNFSTFIKRFGYEVPLNNSTNVSKSLNKLLHDVKHKAEQNVVETLAVRTMSKAEYSTRNIGHYGLSFDFYTHFTSPIRRYPDMMVHRLLAYYLDGGKSVNQAEYEELCKHSSSMEGLAANAERSSIKYKQVEFMEDKIGSIFKGVISGVTEWGIYVELENMCEGMIPIRSLKDDFYIFDEENYCLVGKRTHNIFQLGEDLTIKVVRADLEKKQLDFELVSE
ncbi:MAG: ribonuclease R [Bacteroidales bacterium]